MRNRIFLDFDGTLIDSSQRLYNLFCELAPATTFTYSEYWQIKRARVDQATLLRRHFGLNDMEIAEFRAKWLAQIEDSGRLDSDRPYAGVQEFLAHAGEQCCLYLVTARQHPDLVIAQLKHFGWTHFFRDVLVTKRNESKVEIICRHTTCGTNDAIVGDTGEDILTGKTLRIKTVAVTCGTLCEEVLKEYQPDFIVDSVVELPKKTDILEN